VSPVKRVTVTVTGRSISVPLLLDGDVYHGLIEVDGVRLRLTAARSEFFWFWRAEDQPGYRPMERDGWTFVAIPIHEDR
jgi:hypothetical protein